MINKMCSTVMLLRRTVKSFRKLMECISSVVHSGIKKQQSCNVGSCEVLKQESSLWTKGARLEGWCGVAVPDSNFLAPVHFMLLNQLFNSWILLSTFLIPWELIQCIENVLCFWLIFPHTHLLNIYLQNAKSEFWLALVFQNMLLYY